MKKSVPTTLLIFGLLLATFSCGLKAQQEESPKTKMEIEAFLKRVIDKFDIPGLSIAIVQDEELFYAGAFGFRNLETKDVMTTESLFHMASVSKPFVATAIMQLVEQGKIKLEAKVTDYLPYFLLEDERYKEITILQMLNHSSGMPDVLDYEWEKPQTDVGAAERYVRSLSDEILIYDPGTDWQYSNMAFDALGDVIAKVSGMPFEDYVKKNIFEPLGMVNSNFLYPETNQSLRTSPHSWNGQPAVNDVYPYNRRHAPSSTLNSSVLELTHWAMANLGQGEWNGNRILKKESYKMLWQPSHKLADAPTIGLSWFLDKHRGLKTVSHSGGDIGYSSYLGLIPERNMGIMIASNYDFSPVAAIYHGVLDILLGHTAKIPKQNIAIPFAEKLMTEGLEAAKSLYHKLEKNNRSEYQFDDGQLNRLGYFLIENKQVESAIAVFRFNTELYPKVANCYDSLGEAYMLAGNKELAIENYSKVLELDPKQENAQQMLYKLRK